MLALITFRTCLIFFVIEFEDDVRIHFSIYFSVSSELDFNIVDGEFTLDCIQKYNF